MRLRSVIIIVLCIIVSGCCRIETARYATLNSDRDYLVLHVDGNWAMIITVEGPFPADNHPMDIKIKKGIEISGKTLLVFGKDFSVYDDRVIGGEILLDMDEKSVSVNLVTKYAIWPKYNDKYKLR